MVIPFQSRVVPKKNITVMFVFEGESSCLVKAGDSVVPTTIILEGRSSSILQSIQLSRELGVKASDVQKYVSKADGELVEKGDIIAKKTVGMGTVERSVKALTSGRVSLDRLLGGVVDIRAPFSEISHEAGIHGRVKRILPMRYGRREIQFEVTGYNAQVFNVSGGVVSGEVMILKDGTSIYRPSDVSGRCNGKIVVAGRSLSMALYEALVSAGARGVIVGGMPRTEYSLLEEFPIPIVITEGWGIIPVNKELLDLLSEDEKTTCFIEPEGAGVTICPSESVPDVRNGDRTTEVMLVDVVKGMSVQVWEMPYWGYTGSVRDVLEDDGLVNVTFESGRTISYRPGSLSAISEK